MKPVGGCSFNPSGAIPAKISIYLIPICFVLPLNYSTYCNAEI